jgi:hypothetical protein
LLRNAFNSMRRILRSTNHPKRVVLAHHHDDARLAAARCICTGRGGDKEPPALSGGNPGKDLSMKTKAIAAAAALLALGLMTNAGLAQDGLPDDPMSNENTIPAPEADVPTDPAADDNPAARVPTSPPGTGQYELRKEGSGRGTSGQNSDQQNYDN